MKFRDNHNTSTLTTMPPASASAALPPEEVTTVSSAPAAAPSSWRDRILRLGGSWVGFTGLYAVVGGGTCPFCGQPGCPTGFLSAGVVGGVLAAGLQAWREKRTRREQIK